MSKALKGVVLATALSACKLTQPPAGSIKDVGFVKLSNGKMAVLYSDAGNVYLRACVPPITPPLNRECPTDKEPGMLSLNDYLAKLPYDPGPYERSDSGQAVVAKLLADANAAVAAGNQSAAPTVTFLTRIADNLDKILTVKKNLGPEQKDLTYYEYNDEFSKLLIPFSETGDETWQEITSPEDQLMTRKLVKVSCDITCNSKITTNATGISGFQGDGYTTSTSTKSDTSKQRLDLSRDVEDTPDKVKAAKDDLAGDLRRICKITGTTHRGGTETSPITATVQAQEPSAVKCDLAPYTETRLIMAADGRRRTGTISDLFAQRDYEYGKIVPTEGNNTVGFLPEELDPSISFGDLRVGDKISYLVKICTFGGCLAKPKSIKIISHINK